MYKSPPTPWTQTCMEKYVVALFGILCMHGCWFFVASTVHSMTCMGEGFLFRDIPASQVSSVLGTETDEDSSVPTTYASMTLCEWIYAADRVVLFGTFALALFVHVWFFSFGRAKMSHNFSKAGLFHSNGIEIGCGSPRMAMAFPMGNCAIPSRKKHHHVKNA